ncbi:MAG: pyridoxamine 5'-phosphate oxidase family protein [Acidobacteriota bacterium]
MAKQFPRIEEPHREFIERQHIFFNASAAAEGHVNVSPRDRKSLRVLDDHTVLYLDLTGSGNETAAHLRANGRLTLMFCSFEGPPLILRLYGTGRVIRRDSQEYNTLLSAHYEGVEPLGARQITMLNVELVQTSCGYGVPLFEYKAERDTLTRWTEAKGVDGLHAYWREKNQCSIDGFPTGLLEDETADAIR